MSQNVERESDSFDTDGSFTTHKKVIRETSSPDVEVDSHVNRFGESHPRPTLGNTEKGAQIGASFEHDEHYDWSHDPRSESFNERIGSEDDKRDDQYIAKQIQEQLMNHPEVDSSRVTTRIEHGLIFLTGEVSSERELEIIKKLTKEIYGATGVMNTINIHQTSYLETRGLIKGLH